MRSYGLAGWLDYYDTHAIMCAQYCTSCCIEENCQMNWIGRSQASSQDPSKYLRIMLSRTLLIALDDTLPSCLAVHSQVSSQDALNHTPNHTLKYTPKCPRWHSQPAWLDTPKKALKTLPSTLGVRSQVHIWVRNQSLSQACSQQRSWLYWMTHSRPAWLYAPM